jgi:LTXXQ motif family protein
MIKASEQQKVALDELRKVARQSSEAMARACEGETPASVPAKIDASEKRLEIALMNVKRIMPVAKKFYGTLSEEQKVQLNNFFDWPNW